MLGLHDPSTDKIGTGACFIQAMLKLTVVQKRLEVTKTIKQGLIMGEEAIFFQPNWSISWSSVKPLEFQKVPLCSGNRNERLPLNAWLSRTLSRLQGTRLNAWKEVAPLFKKKTTAAALGGNVCKSIFMPQETEPRAESDRYFPSVIVKHII